MIARRPDWRGRLAEFVIARRLTPFQWGVADCCLTVADAVAAMTGQDFAQPLRGYHSRFGALRSLRRAGFTCVSDFLDTLFPRALRPRAGDVVALPDPPLDVLMIVDRTGAAWGQDDNGLIRIPIPAIARAWRI